MEHSQSAGGGSPSDEERMDAEAMRRFLEGDESAFDELVKRYTAPVYSLGYRMLGSAEAAEDAVQEIFAKVYRAAGRFDLSQRFFPWLYTIALNHLRSQLRSRKKLFNSGALAFDEELSTPGGGGRGPEEEVMRQEAEEQVQKALQQLKPIQRAVFLLRNMQELSVHETANILDIPENTVKTHFRRAREELRKKLSRMGWG
jgi:RNA polymerase sigma-70 factor (ECF subfamily)